MTDGIQQIAISQIADVLSKGILIKPKTDIWKIIFYNAGQTELYDLNSTRLQSRCVDSYEGIYKHDDRCYSALQEIFSELLAEFDIFTKLMNKIADKINDNIYNIFDRDIEKKLKTTSRYYFDILEYMEKQSMSRNIELLDKYPSDDFKCLRCNLNILGLDISFNKGEKYKLVVIPFSFIQNSKDKILLNEWLEQNYPNILDSYESAVKAWGSGDKIGTLTHCRNVLTGILTYSKKEKTTWYNGLQTVCKNDKNIMNIESPKNILSWGRANIHSDKINFQYNYPRFKLIAQLYSYLCDLGDHINEAPIVNGVPDYEITNLQDAFMGLRITEDVLIWLYQSQQINL